MSGQHIAAAGGVVWRGEQQKVEVALVHRPRYDDWSLPKGKLHTGEPPLLGAVREVREELGASVGVAQRLDAVEYCVDGASKTVDFWAMRHLGGQFEKSDEVDALEWFGVADATGRVSYDTDRRVLAGFAARPAPDAVVVLVRHARAGKRTEWDGDDALRPLDDIGRQQAEGLVEFLSCFAPDRLLSADRARCTETLAPYAQRSGLPLEVDPVFSDEFWERSSDTVRAAVLSLAVPGRTTVICSQGLTIPSLVEQLGVGVTDSSTRKAAAWVLSFAAGSVIATDYYDRPFRVR